jgi:hypothetical protein
MPFVIKNRHGRYDGHCGDTDNIERAEIWDDTDKDSPYVQDAFEIVDIVIMTKQDFDDFIDSIKNMRIECSECREKLDTYINAGVRRVDPCQRGCRG